MTRRKPAQHFGIKCDTVEIVAKASDAGFRENPGFAGVDGKEINKKITIYAFAGKGHTARAREDQPRMNATDEVILTELRKGKAVWKRLKNLHYLVNEAAQKIKDQDPCSPLPDTISAKMIYRCRKKYEGQF